MWIRIVFAYALLTGTLAWAVEPFITHNYIDLQNIQKISRFRSGIGHDYSFTETDETCRSMKHYFVPYEGLDWSTINIFCPVSGTVFIVEEEWTGWKVQLLADAPSDVIFIFFHITPKAGLEVNSHVEAGECIGTHIGNETFCDISIIYQGHLRSFFELITDDVLQEYLDRGASWRYDFIITKGERDADPLTCDGTAFLTSGTIPNWVELAPPVEGEEGIAEGEAGGEGSEEGEGMLEGEGEGDEEGLNEGEGEGQVIVHSADQNADGQIDVSELLRVIQFYNSNGLHCQAGTEDGYAPGEGDYTCSPHSSDYAPQDWRIGLSELLRLIQFYNSEGYHVCEGGEDGFCPEGAKTGCS
ncbi:MAG TPA: hypothetical protein PLI09_14065 [Candidatus Hydrogenedentes bacterium]|nr:hypothetical protein [Candidatus Hydrogenedentota bacterium]